VDAAVANAVAELLAEVGYDSLTIEGVAARAGVAKTTVYRRWSSKTQLVAEALDWRAHAKGGAVDTGSLRGDLLAYMRSVTTSLGSPLGQAVIGLVSAARHHPQLAEGLRQGFVATRRAELGDLLSRAQARGELRGGLDHRAVIDLIISPLWYRALVWRQSVDDGFLACLVDVITYGLRGDTYGVGSDDVE
jgi:AcrR family transcriptional regulator